MFAGNVHATATKVADMKLYSPKKSSVWFNEFDYPILYFIPKTVNYTTLKPKNPNEPLYYCLNWNEVLENWVIDKCDYDQENFTHIACACYHFTPVIAKINVNNVLESSKPTFD